VKLIGEIVLGIVFLVFGGFIVELVYDAIWLGVLQILKALF
jgi:hypothetical protein